MHEDLNVTKSQDSGVARCCLLCVASRSCFGMPYANESVIPVLELVLQGGKTQMARLSPAILSAIAVTFLSASVSAAPVALLDVGKVFKNYSGFNSSLEKMKGEVQAFEQKLKQEQSRLQSQGQELQELSPGSSDYKQREQALARKVADMRVEMELKRKEMLEREAKLYHRVYQQIVGVVQQIASERKIGIVQPTRL